jgi:hypothetical protein
MNTTSCSLELLHRFLRPNNFKNPPVKTQLVRFFQEAHAAFQSFDKQRDTV